MVTVTILMFSYSLTLNPNPMRKKFITYRTTPAFYQFEGEPPVQLPMVGVWEWNGWKYNVIDAGDDLEELKHLHGVEDENVFTEKTDNDES